MKKPGFGFKENQIKYIVGRRLIKNVTSKRILKKKKICYEKKKNMCCNK